MTTVIVLLTDVNDGHPEWVSTGVGVTGEELGSSLLSLYSWSEILELNDVETEDGHPGWVSTEEGVT